MVGGEGHLRLKYDFEALPANDIEQRQSWAFGLFGATFQLGDEACRQIQILCKSGLAQVFAFPQRADLFPAARHGRRQRCAGKAIDYD